LLLSIVKKFIRSIFIKISKYIVIIYRYQVNYESIKLNAETVYEFIYDIVYLFANNRYQVNYESIKLNAETVYEFIYDDVIINGVYKFKNIDSLK
jgi:hypothetical protein